MVIGIVGIIGIACSVLTHYSVKRLVVAFVSVSVLGIGIGEGLKYRYRWYR